MPNQAHELVIQGRDQEDAPQLAAAIAALPSFAGAEVLPWREVVPQLARMIAMKGWMDLFFVGVLFIAAAAGIANTAMMSTFERTHEFGMLLAVGTRPGRIVNMVLIESVVLGLLGVTRDVTERKKMEREIIAANKRRSALTKPIAHFLRRPATICANRCRR